MRERTMRERTKMMTMRSLALLACAALLGACAKKADNAATDTAAMNAAAPAAETPMAAAMIPAGTWNGRAMPAERDTVLTWTMVTTADTTGWTITFPKGKPMPLRVISRTADSTITEFGPFPDPMTKGQMTTVRGVTRMEGDSVVGTYEARDASKPDSVMRGRSVATRAP